MSGDSIYRPHDVTRYSSHVLHAALKYSDVQRHTQTKLANTTENVVHDYWNVDKSKNPSQKIW